MTSELYPGGAVFSKIPRLSESKYADVRSMLQPGLRRPMTENKNISRRGFGGVQVGKAMSNLSPTISPKNAGGVTPSTCTERPSIMTVVLGVIGWPPIWAFQ